jgi:hypothetical protein
MANWCYNYVTCTGSAADIAKLKQTLLDGLEYMRVHREATTLGVELQEGAFFDIFIGDEVKPTTLNFTYETKWSPNLLDLAEVCKSHNVSALNEYNECGMQIYGKARITPWGDIMNDEVSADFLNLIEYNEETGAYEYDGVEHETEGDIIDEHYENWKFLNGYDN